MRRRLAANTAGSKTERQGVSGGHPNHVAKFMATTARPEETPRGTRHNSIRAHHVPRPPQLHARRNLKPHHTTPVAWRTRQQPHSTRRPHPSSPPPNENNSYA